jgi:hypothetical protein
MFQFQVPANGGQSFKPTEARQTRGYTNQLVVDDDLSIHELIIAMLAGENWQLYSTLQRGGSGVPGSKTTSPAPKN